ncbi:MAG: hypothetical protein HC857_13820 [Synechococcales cyanobacterium RU_4_20]|nr:hypothetical protein [Synechococcales cyanobacterium RU_4_20]NJR71383.1 hypothetical protein [Synechococcales cyanobacterium CRU_2_2]
MTKSVNVYNVVSGVKVREKSVLVAISWTAIAADTTVLTRRSKPPF